MKQRSDTERKASPKFKIATDMSDSELLMSFSKPLKQWDLKLYPTNKEIQVSPAQNFNKLIPREWSGQDRPSPAAAGIDPKASPASSSEGELGSTCRPGQTRFCPWHFYRMPQNGKWAEVPEGLDAQHLRSHHQNRSQPGSHCPQSLSAQDKSSTLTALGPLTVREKLFRSDSQICKLDLSDICVTPHGAEYSPQKWFLGAVSYFPWHLCPPGLRQGRSLLQPAKVLTMEFAE